LEGDLSDYVERYDYGIDGMTSSINIPKSKKIAIYTPARLFLVLTMDL